MADSKFSRFDKLNNTIERTLECPVCLEVVRVPFKQCLRGHVICVACAKSLSVCPSCQGIFISTNPVVVLHLLHALPKRCRYHTKGCRELQEEDHETFCGFRPALCRLRKCQVVSALPLHELQEHIEIAHKEEVITSDIYCSSATWARSFQQIRPVSLLGQLFWLTLKNECRYKTVKLEAVLIGKPENEFYVTVNVKNGRFVASDTIQAYVRKPEEEEGEIATRSLCSQQSGGKVYKDVLYTDQDYMRIKTAFLDGPKSYIGLSFFNTNK